MFNALKYTEELEKAGFTREQAEASLKLLVETMNENFATKADLKELGWQIKESESRLESKIQNIATKLDSSMKELEYKMTIKVGTMMVVSVTVLGALIRLIPVAGH